MDASAPGRTFTRRLLFAVLWLVLLDPLVPALLRRLEARRYERTAGFRFHDSDLFGLGPLVSYLRDHPDGERRRAVFFGNSIVFGWGLDPTDTMPAMYERQRPDVHAFNAAINGESLGTSFLVVRSIIDSVDALFVQVVGVGANPMLPNLIPIEENDARFFGLDHASSVGDRLEAAARRCWRLYRFHHRLQAAMFGTSTRNFLYVRIAQLFERRQQRLEHTPVGHMQLRAPRSRGAGIGATRQHEILRKFAELARSKRKRIVLLAFEYGGHKVSDAPIGAFNTRHEPYAEIVVITIPPGLTHDGMHPTPAGNREIASLLLRHEEQARLRVLPGR